MKNSYIAEYLINTMKWYVINEIKEIENK